MQDYGFVEFSLPISANRAKSALEKMRGPYYPPAGPLGTALSGTPTKRVTVPGKDASGEKAETSKEGAEAAEGGEPEAKPQEAADVEMKEEATVGANKEAGDVKGEVKTEGEQTQDAVKEETTEGEVKGEVKEEETNEEVNVDGSAAADDGVPGPPAEEQDQAVRIIVIRAHPIILSA